MSIYNTELKKPEIEKFTLDPYSARVFIVNLEKQHSLGIRVYDISKYCVLCIDKADKEYEVHCGNCDWWGYKVDVRPELGCPACLSSNKLEYKEVSNG